MTIIYEKEGSREISQQQLEQICEILGYNPRYTSAIQIRPSAGVQVDQFVRLDDPPLRLLGNDHTQGYLKVRITHPIEPYRIRRSGEEVAQ